MATAGSDDSTRTDSNHASFALRMDNKAVLLRLNALDEVTSAKLCASPFCRRRQGGVKCIPAHPPGTAGQRNLDRAATLRCDRGPGQRRWREANYVLAKIKRLKRCLGFV
jgi:hypothetical protein